MAQNQYYFLPPARIQVEHSTLPARIKKTSTVWPAWRHSSRFPKKASSRRLSAIGATIRYTLMIDRQQDRFRGHTPRAVLRHNALTPVEKKIPHMTRRPHKHKYQTYT